MLVFSLEMKRGTHHLDHIMNAFDMVQNWHVLVPSILIALSTIVPQKWRYDWVAYWGVVAIVAGIAIVYIVNSVMKGKIDSETTTPIRFASFSLAALGFSSQITRMPLRVRFWVLWGTLPILVGLLFLPILIRK